MVRAAVTGVSGRMGSAIIRALDLTGGIELVSAVARTRPSRLPEGHPPVVSSGGRDIPIIFDIAQMTAGVDVLIDFTSPEGTLKSLSYCADKGIAAVTGTTGFSPGQTGELENLAGRIPLVVSPNMSIAVNLLFRLAATAASVLGEDFDAEIVEVHHRMKKDAPSGTALHLAGEIARARGKTLEGTGVFSRHGLTGERTRSEIGIHAVRGGDIVGEHTLLLAGPGERLELTHRAHSRENFARGAVRAALWVIGKKPGMYSLMDVLGIK